MATEHDFSATGRLIDPKAARQLSAATGEEAREARNRLANRSQEVHDAQGRRRFHGAFTGGWSAGYFNTVGSAEGWAPSTFVSSRAERAGRVARTAQDYMDEEDDALVGGSLSASAGYASRAAGRVRADDAAVQLMRGAAESLAGAPDLAARAIGDLYVPESFPMGEQLLRQMGWRPGRPLLPPHMWFDKTVKERYEGKDVSEMDWKAAWEASSLVTRRSFGVGYDPGSLVVEPAGSKRARAADDLPRLGYDPDAISKKRLHMSASLDPKAYAQASLSHITLDDEDDDAAEYRQVAFDTSIDLHEEDEGPRTRPLRQLQLGDTEKSAKLMIKDAPRAERRSERGTLPGFHVAPSNTRVFMDLVARYPLPPVPPDYTGHHVFAAPLDSGAEPHSHPEAQSASLFIRPSAVPERKEPVDTASAALINAAIATPIPAPPPKYMFKRFVPEGATAENASATGPTDADQAPKPGPDTQRGQTSGITSADVGFLVQRSVRSWVPAPLLLKRWNVAPPTSQ